MRDHHISSADRVPFVDAHVHHWDPSKPDWYPYLAPGADLPHLGLGDISGMKRYFGQGTLLSEARPWTIAAYVHVSAATAPGMHLRETDMLVELAARTGSPSAIVGSVDPTEELVAIETELDRQLESPLFRGVRIMDGLDYRSARATQILNLVAERGLVYDLHIQAKEMHAAARAVEQVSDLTVVVEHCGGPSRSDDPAGLKAWQQGISELAERPNTSIKFSGLAMTLHRISVDAFRPWFEHMASEFGPRRVLMGSNFPVDGLYGTLPNLLDTYLELARPLGTAAVAAMFADTARHIYLSAAAPQEPSRVPPESLKGTP